MSLLAIVPAILSLFNLFYSSIHFILCIRTVHWYFQLGNKLCLLLLEFNTSSTQNSSDCV